MTADVIDLAPRRVTVGGSDIASAAGIDPWRSRVMLWAEKTGRIVRPESEPMLWGTLLQPVIANVLDAQGYDVQPPEPAELQDEARSYLIGHPDYFGTVEGESAVIEVKTASHWQASEWEGDAAPVHYLAQLQHYLALAGCRVGMLACLLGGQRLVTRIVWRDDDVIDLLHEAAEQFIGYVRRDEAPPPDGTDSAGEALRELYPLAEPGRTVRLDAAALDVLDRLLQRKAQLAAVKRQADELEQTLKATIGTAERAIDRHDREVARWASFTKRQFDVKAFRAAHPSLAEQFTTELPQRRFTVHGPEAS